jgi:hypothetical protein
LWAIGFGPDRIIALIPNRRRKSERAEKLFPLRMKFFTLAPGPPKTARREKECAYTLVTRPRCAGSSVRALAPASALEPKDARLLGSTGDAARDGNIA